LGHFQQWGATDIAGRLRGGLSDEHDDHFRHTLASPYRTSAWGWTFCRGRFLLLSPELFGVPPALTVANGLAQFHAFNLSFQG
jgi:hypothetical protein